MNHIAEPRAGSQVLDDLPRDIEALFRGAQALRFSLPSELSELARAAGIGGRSDASPVSLGPATSFATYDEIRRRTEVAEDMPLIPQRHVLHRPGVTLYLGAVMLANLHVAATLVQGYAQVEAATDLAGTMVPPAIHLVTHREGDAHAATVRSARAQVHEMAARRRFEPSRFLLGAIGTLGDLALLCHAMHRTSGMSWDDGPVDTPASPAHIAAAIDAADARCHGAELTLAVAALAHCGGRSFGLVARRLLQADVDDLQAPLSALRRQGLLRADLPASHEVRQSALARMPCGRLDRALQVISDMP